MTKRLRHLSPVRKERDHLQHLVCVSLMCPFTSRHIRAHHQKMRKRFVYLVWSLKTRMEIFTRNRSIRTIGVKLWHRDLDISVSWHKHLLRLLSREFKRKLTRERIVPQAPPDGRSHSSHSTEPTVLNISECCVKTFACLAAISNQGW